MDVEHFRYKRNIVTFSLLIAYTLLHVELSNCFVDWHAGDPLIYAQKLPFVSRLLIPVMSGWLSGIVFLHVKQLWVLFDFIFLAGFYYAFIFLCSSFISKNEAQCLAWIFLLLLPLVTLLNYRYPVSQGKEPIYWYYDTPALFFTVFGLGLCLKQHWKWLVTLIFVATLNRESSILLVFLILVLHWPNRRFVFKPFIFAFLSFVLARGLVLYLVEDSNGFFVEFLYGETQYLNFEVNLMRLFAQHQLLYCLFFFAGLPVFWFAFYDYIPKQFRPMKYLLFFYFLGLLVVGHIAEARIFGEIVALLYLPVCLALRRWLQGEAPILTNYRKVWYFLIDRYAILSAMTCIILFRFQLIQAGLFLQRHFFSF